MGFSQGPLAALIADAAPVEWRGTAFGLFSLVSGFALLIASVVAGQVWGPRRPTGYFLCRRRPSRTGPARSTLADPDAAHASCRELGRAS